jgi:hypothetical protein
VKRVRLLIGALLILVTLGSIVSPALAVSIEQKSSVCLSCSKVTTGKSKVTVVEINGIEKNEILAKALKNKDVKKLVSILARRGYYKENLMNIHIKRVYASFGSATIVTIPLKTYEKNKVAEIAIIMTKKGTKTYAIELLRNNKNITGKLYYIDSKGTVKYVTLDSQSFWNCLYRCVGGAAGIAGCARVCVRCAGTGGEDIWDCLLCAICLGNAGCCIGKCAMNEPWGPGFCATMYIDCILGYSGACIIYAGCEGHCPL